MQILLVLAMAHACAWWYFCVTWYSYHFNTSDQRKLQVYISHINLWSGIYPNYIPETTGTYHNKPCGFCCHGNVCVYTQLRFCTVLIIIIIITIQKFKLCFNIILFSHIPHLSTSIFHFWAMSWITSFLYYIYISLHKCIYNLTNVM